MKELPNSSECKKCRWSCKAQLKRLWPVGSNLRTPLISPNIPQDLTPFQPRRRVYVVRCKFIKLRLPAPLSSRKISPR
jgi:hypothetical protein